MLSIQRRLKVDATSCYIDVDTTLYTRYVWYARWEGNANILQNDPDILQSCIASDKRGIRNSFLTSPQNHML